MTAFKERLRKDPSGAEEWFAKKASYRWDDLDALPLIGDVLMSRMQFHSHIAGWINMTYTEFRHSRLKPLVHALAKHPENLEGWAKQLLVE